MLGVCGPDQAQLGYPSWSRELECRRNSRQKYTVHHEHLVVPHARKNVLVLVVPVNVLWEIERRGAKNSIPEITYPNHRRVTTVHRGWFNCDITFDVRVQVPGEVVSKAVRMVPPSCAPKADSHVLGPPEDVSLLEGTPRETESTNRFGSL